MYSLDHDDPLPKGMKFNSANSTFMSAERISRLIEEMNDATMRCHACHRILFCGDGLVCIPLNATVWTTQEDDTENPALIITEEDDFQSML